MKVLVNGGKRTVTVDAGRPLLFGLMSGGIFIPSACGGQGSCGQCKVRIPAGAPPHVDAERLLIPEEDRAAGVHLSCQVRAAADLSIEIQDRFFAARQYRARVAGIRDLTGEIRELTLEVMDPGGLSFSAGQYIQLFLPGTETAPQPLYRAYSMASPPSSTRLLSFFVKREPGGIVSPYVCDRLAAGDELAVRGPFGDFRLRESSSEILFVAGGSGLAPIRSMVLDMAEKGVHRPATLYFSVRARRDLFKTDELEVWERTMAGFRFIPVLSNPLPHEPWEGEKGGITTVLNRKLGRLDNHEAYLCGSAGMIDACRRVLEMKGLTDERVFFDKFL